MGFVSRDCAGLVIIKHPGKGDAENGKVVCDEIRKKISAISGQVCIYHDASMMEHANTGYAGAFKELDKDISERVNEIVCAIPGSIPRMMAHTVAMFSSKRWSIYKTKAEAETYLAGMGFQVKDAKEEKDSAVSLVGV